MYYSYIKINAIYPRYTIKFKINILLEKELSNNSINHNTYIIFFFFYHGFWSLITIKNNKQPTWQIWYICSSVIIPISFQSHNNNNDDDDDNDDDNDDDDENFKQKTYILSCRWKL